MNALFKAPGKETKLELGRCDTLLADRIARGVTCGLERVARRKAT